MLDLQGGALCGEQIVLGLREIRVFPAPGVALAVNANLLAVPLFMGVAGILYGLHRLRSTNRPLLEDMSSWLLYVIHRAPLGKTTECNRYWEANFIWRRRSTTSLLCSTGATVDLHILPGGTESMLLHSGVMFFVRYDKRCINYEPGFKE